MQGKLTALSILTLWTQAYKIPSSARVNVLILGMRSLGQVWSPDLVVIPPREALVEGSSFDLDFGTWNFQLFWTANVYIVGSGLRLYAGQRKASWREKKITQKMRHKMDFQLRRITDNTNLSASGYPQTQEKSERRCREKQLVSKDLVPFLPPYCSSCSDLQSLVILRTAQSSAPHASLGYLQMVSFLVWWFYGVSTPCVETGTHWVITGSAFWQGKQPARCFREYFQSLCWWGRAEEGTEREKLSGGVTPCTLLLHKVSVLSCALYLGEFSQASMRGTDAHSLLSNSLNTSCLMCGVTVSKE